MPEGHLDHAIMSSFETMAPFDEFQNWSLDPDQETPFEDLEDLDLIEE